MQGISEGSSLGSPYFNCVAAELNVDEFLPRLGNPAQAAWHMDSPVVVGYSAEAIACVSATIVSGSCCPSVFNDDANVQISAYEEM
jgi:hypothetical protein